MNSTMNPGKPGTVEEPQTIYYKLRKSLMLQIWRVEQARAIITLFFWSLALAGIFYDKVAWRFKDWFGLSPTQNVVEITIILTFFVILGIVAFGFIYDRVFRMWEFKSQIITEKDVFRHGKMNDKEIHIYHDLWDPLVCALQNIDEGETMDPAVKSMKRWLETHEVVYYDDGASALEGAKPGQLELHSYASSQTPSSQEQVSGKAGSQAPAKAGEAQAPIIQNIQKYYAGDKIDIKDSVISKSSIGETPADKPEVEERSASRSGDEGTGGGEE